MATLTRIDILLLQFLRDNKHKLYTLLNISVQYMIRLLTTLAIVPLISGCNGLNPDCPMESQQPHLTGNAGCWLQKNKKLLLIEQSNGLYSFPGGTAEFAESAQCTAHRETWEEAGVDVKVGKLKHQFDNGFYLFNCYAETLSLATNDASEVDQVVLLAPQEIPAEKWRFPEQRIQAIEWLTH